MKAPTHITAGRTAIRLLLVAAVLTAGIVGTVGTAAAEPMDGKGDDPYPDERKRRSVRVARREGQRRVPPAGSTLARLDRGRDRDCRVPDRQRHRERRLRGERRRIRKSQSLVSTDNNGDRFRTRLARSPSIEGTHRVLPTRGSPAPRPTRGAAPAADTAPRRRR
jgi:hypothetical protein